MSDVASTISERGKRYGEYSRQAMTVQAIKSAIQSAPSWSKATAGQREALDNIATKIGRIVNGDPHHADSWHDIAGYAQLAERECDS